MKVKLFATFREIVQNKTLDIPYRENMTIRELLDQLIQSYPLLNEEIYTGERELKPHVQIFINGKNIRHADGLETRFQADDEIALFPPVAGG
ncbi:hypothetical protein BSNK01_21460 [Bacillaceae bacterium]